MQDRIAVTHPGKMGDAIYALPAIRFLCEKHGKKADFYTSQYCAPLRNLFEYQSCIASFNISQDYIIEHMNMGVQPWLVPIPNGYEITYHLGFRHSPRSKTVPEYICNFLNIPNQKIFYEHPDFPTLENYVIVAPRGEDFWIDKIKGITESTIVQIGAKGDYVGNIGIDKTGLDFLETTTWISKARVFMGCMSSQLVLAEGFPITRYVKIQNKIVRRGSGLYELSRNK